MLWAAFAVVFLILWAVAFAAMPAVRWLGRRFARLIARSAKIETFVSAQHERVRDYLPVIIIVIAGAALTAWAFGP